MPDRSKCARCGADLPWRAPLDVVAVADSGHARRRHLFVYCADCSPVILAALAAKA